MKVQISNSCGEFSSYRASRVKSLFNVESGANFLGEIEVPDDAAWKIGVIVGPSGSGKTTGGRLVFPGVEITDLYAGWADNEPIIDCIGPGRDFNEATGALSAVGLGDVPAWLRPFHALSNGQQFRAGLARVIVDAPERVVIDEFTSVVDRQIAKIGASAFAKSWRRTGGRAVLLTCHYDILDWVEPDWVYDTGARKLARGALWRRPKLDVDVFETDGSYWPMFEPHHYLKLPRMVAAKYYVGVVAGEPVAHIAVSPKLEVGGMRACRMVVMPEWQGAGVGTRFLDEVARLQFTPANKYYKRARAVYFHTSHPGLTAALVRSKRWAIISAQVGGSNKGKSASSIRKSRTKTGTAPIGVGYGGHIRAVNGFRCKRATLEHLGVPLC